MGSEQMPPATPAPQAGLWGWTGLNLPAPHVPGFDVHGGLRSNSFFRHVEDTVTGNFSSAKYLISDLEGSSDFTLRLMSRILTAVVLITLVAILVGVCYLKHLERQGKQKPFRPMRFWYKVKQCLYNTCCCAFCCPSLHAAVAPDYFRPMTPNILRITLVRAEGLQRQTNFYFEARTEPPDSWPKVSRLHKHVAGNSDLSLETIELDWYGDEEGVLVQVVEYHGSLITKDLVLGDIRISRDALQSFANETARAPNDITQGTRVFPVKDFGKKSKITRESRFVETSNVAGVLLKPVYTSIISSLQEQSGEPDAAKEMKFLREEVALLKQENQRLGGQVSFTKRSFEEEEPTVVMTVALRFEIVQTQRLNVTNSHFRMAAPEDQLMAPPPSCTTGCF